jgi:chemotaxis family two-component system sensor kinase Cph1
MGRIHAFTAAYALLSHEGWSPIPLRAILTEELQPFMAAERVNVTLSGPEAVLEPRAALAMEMAVHELTTNAVKYGALSVPEGNVEVRWIVERNADEGQLVLQWIERNGPSVAAPGHRGFGMTLIERVFAHDVGGEAKVDFQPAGVVATLHAPLPGKTRKGSL